MTYSLWFGKKYNKVGHIWQGRFKSSPVLKDEYLLNCINYIEMNPVRAGLVSNPMDYKWSSYKCRMLGIKNGILDIPRLELKFT